MEGALLQADLEVDVLTCMRSRSRGDCWTRRYRGGVVQADLCESGVLTPSLAARMRPTERLLSGMALSCNYWSCLVLDSNQLGLPVPTHWAGFSKTRPRAVKERSNRNAVPTLRVWRGSVLLSRPARAWAQWSRDIAFELALGRAVDGLLREEVPKLRFRRSGITILSSSIISSSSSSTFSFCCFALYSFIFFWFCFINSSSPSSCLIFLKLLKTWW